MEILTPFAGEMLVLVMLVFLNARVFFTRRTRHDALAIFAPLSVFVTILVILSWGIRVANLAILALALLSTILNYRSIVRFSQRLFVDSYSVKFFIVSILLLLASLFLLSFDIIWRPVRLQTRRYNVNVEREYYSADVEVKKSVEVMDKRNLTLYTFRSGEEKLQKNTVVLFCPDVQAEVLGYEPYLILLARSGYTVEAVDLFDDDLKNAKGSKFLRRFLLVYDSVKNGILSPAANGAEYQKALSARATEFAQIYENSYNALASIAKQKYPEKSIFVVCDSSSALAQEKLDAIFAKHFPAPDARAFPSSLDLSSIKEYSTPGFGFVAQTNPAFAKLFLGVDRDKKSFAPSYCVYQTEKVVGSR